MDKLFYGAASFNGNIDNWKFQKVIRLSETFRMQKSFNISGWQTLKLRNNGVYICRDADSFNVDINSWDVEEVVNMNYLFRETAKYDQPLNGWITSS